MNRVKKHITRLKYKAEFIYNSVTNSFLLGYPTCYLRRIPEFQPYIQIKSSYYYFGSNTKFRRGELTSEFNK